MDPALLSMLRKKELIEILDLDPDLTWSQIFNKIRELKRERDSFFSETVDLKFKLAANDVSEKENVAFISKNYP